MDSWDPLGARPSQDETLYNLYVVSVTLLKYFRSSENNF